MRASAAAAAKAAPAKADESGKKKESNWNAPTEENPKTFKAIEAMLKKNKIDYKLSKHQPVRTSEEAA